MLIATFNATTGWAGRAITFEHEQFALEGVGPLSASDVLTYDQQGHLDWAHDGTRAWVEAAANSSCVPWPATTAAASPMDKAAGAEAFVRAAPRPALVRTVDVTRVSRGDWVICGGFLALLLGTSLPWYTWSGSLFGAEFQFVDIGWTSAAGVLTFFAGLTAAVVVILASGVLRQLHIDFRGRVPLVVIGLGGLALAVVLVRLVAGPGASSGFGLGIFVSLLGAATVAVGGLLKLGEPTHVVAPSRASAAVDNAMKSAKAAFTAARVAVAAQNDARTPAQLQPTVIEPPRTPAQVQPTVIEPPRESPGPGPKNGSRCGRTPGPQRWKRQPPLRGVRPGWRSG